MILLTCALYTYFQKTSWLIVIELASTYTFSNYHWFDDVDKLFFRINLMNKNAFYRYRVYIPPPVQLYNSNVPTQRSHIAILIIVPIPARMYASRIVLLAPLARHTLDVHACACICIYPRMSFGLPHSLENSRHGREWEREREREREGGKSREQPQCSGAQWEEKPIFYASAWQHAAGCTIYGQYISAAAPFMRTRESKRARHCLF